MTDSSYNASGNRSIAAHTIGHAHTGDVIGLPAEILTAARDVPAPPGLANLPPVPLCLGRDDDLTRLRTTLTEQNGTAITQASTVHGLGGIGKTTLALAYAHRQRHAYSLVWWLNADSPTRLEQSLAALATRLAPTLTRILSQDSQADWAMAWLQWHPGWLLVFDNVESPTDLNPYLGALDGGHHLVTSRRATGWPRTIHTLALGTLDPDEAANLICTHAIADRTPTPRDRQAAHALAADLGHLPLALEQAGAYLGQNPTIGIDAYRRRLTVKLDKTADGLDAERTIARIWDQTLRALTARNPLAVDILHTIAWLAPDNIPVSLLAGPGVDADDLAEALGLLAAYSMATLTPDTISVHRLLQTVLRTTAPTNPDGSPAGRREAEHALTRELTALPAPTSGPAPGWDTLIPHLIALATTHDHQNESTTTLYARAAEYLYLQGHNARTIPLREAALAQSEEHVGSTHPDTLANRNNLASAYRDAGNLDRAISLYELTLTQREQTLGDTHHSILTSRNNLAYAYQTAGDLERAIPLHETTLSQYEQTLGDTHPDTLTSRNNLALAYRAAGDLERAIPLLELTLTQCEEHLGDTHPDTLSSRNNLALAHRAAGNLERAIPLYETTLIQYEQTLGDTHPDTLTSRNNLAVAYQIAGDLEHAIPLLELTLTQCQEHLGDTHPDTLNSRNNLALAHRAAGNLDHAIPLLELTLTQREQILGDTHPDTLTSRNNLAVAYRDAGNLEHAIPLLELTVTQSEQTLGDTHPDTLDSRNNLALAHQAAGDLDHAIPLYETTLSQSEQALGKTHPHTETVRANLADARDAARQRQQ
ncbi:FxSxx-COOH system tetratricopeptide repeat protein [Kitasatospora purpeofusca]|uniref:FxSxx-COOH system tetratricopeptide repeat protein n=1 Tax=Kitasatospora purpeofusca TaxID=67352 RepID=UPI0033E7C240